MIFFLILALFMFFVSTSLLVGVAEIAEIRNDCHGITFLLFYCFLMYLGAFASLWVYKETKKG